MKYLIFVVSLIALIITAGCIVQNNNPPVPSTPQIVYVTVPVTPTLTSQIVYVTAPVIPTYKQKSVAVTVERIDSAHILGTYQGGSDAATCVGVYWKVTDPTGASMGDTIMGQNYNLISAPPLSVGLRATLSATTGKDHVVATAYFKDGSIQVILDTYI